MKIYEHLYFKEILVFLHRRQLAIKWKEENLINHLEYFHLQH